MIIVIPDPIYSQTVLVAIAEPRESTILKAIAKAGYSITDPEDIRKNLVLDESEAGRTILDPDTGSVIIRLRRLRRGDAHDVSNLVHECVHAATMLFGRIGHDLSEKSDEPLAYYVGFLVRSVLEKV
jgi:hypothetical protein